MRVRLGAIGSQPLKVKVVGTKAVIAVPAFPIKPVDSVTKMPCAEAIAEGARLLSDAQKQYVPDGTTQASWITAFETFCEQAGKPKDAVGFADFAAGLYYRYKSIPKGQPGHLEISSVYTYLRYVCKKYKQFTLLPSFKSIETEAASVGCLNKAPRAGTEHREALKEYIHQGPESQIRLRGACWLQCVTGGRTCDVSRLRAGGLEFNQDLSISKLNWRWTKSIKKPSDGKFVSPPKIVFDEMGTAPFTARQWRSWGGKDLMSMPFDSYCSDKINPELKVISKDFSMNLTSTSLRDIYHEVVGEVCDKDPVKMVRFTPHKDPKSLAASYLGGRKTTTRKAKKEPSISAKKKK